MQGQLNPNAGDAQWRNLPPERLILRRRQMDQSFARERPFTLILP
jgi:hypothetical protein